MKSDGWHVVLNYTGRGCSTMVEHTPRILEDVDSNPAFCCAKNGNEWQVEKVNLKLVSTYSLNAFLPKVHFLSMELSGGSWT